MLALRVSTVHQIQALVRGRRRDLKESQESVARRSNVSRKWLSEFERGVTTAAELPLVLRTLAALDLEIQIGVQLGSRPGEMNSEGPDIDLDTLLDSYTHRGRAKQ